MAVRAGALLGVRLFGHVTLDFDGEPCPLASPRSTAPLLAYLLLHQGAIAREPLAYALAPDDTEDGARLKLRNNLYRLTKALPPQTTWLIADQESVRWNPEAPLWLDADEFERSGREQDRLEAAVDVYRGDLLMTFSDEWLVEPRERYRTTYLSALSDLVSRHRRARDLPRALAYAQQLLATDPFREDVLRRLIAIRYEMGDRAGALWEYQRFAERLRDELGIEPMPETEALRAAIARGEAVEPGEESTPRTPALVVQTRDLPFVGRHAELERLWDAWSRATRRRGGCVLIGGEAGIGKSRLALEFARSVEERGGRVLSGATGYPEQMPYQALIDALRSVLPLVATVDIGDVWLASLGTLMPELADRFPTLPSLPKVELADERTRLFEALARCLSALAKARPLLVVLEDLQWAGEATIAAIDYLLRRLLLQPVLLLVTYRDDETPRAHPLRRLRRGAHAEGIVGGVTLAPLTKVDLADLGRAVPAMEGKIAALFAASVGNPLFLTQLVDAPIEELSTGAALSAQRLLTGRIEQRSSEARTIAEIAALMGTRFSRDTLVDVSGWPEAAVQAAIDELIEHRIVQETTGRGFLDHAFTHHLIARAVAADAEPQRAAARRRRIARALDDLGDHQSGELSWTIARQYDLAGDHATAAPHYAAAGRRALAVGAIDDAQRAVEQGLATADDARIRADLLLVQETISARNGADAARAAALERLDAAADVLDDDELRRTATLRRAEFAQESGDRDAEARSLERLSGLVGPDAGGAWIGRLRAAQARQAIDLAQLDAAREHADAALQAYLAVGDPDGEALARTEIAEIATFRGDLADAEALLEDARAAAGRAVDTRLTPRLLLMWFHFAFARRDLDRCLACAKGSLEAAISAGDRRAEAYGHTRIAVALSALGGRYSDAHEHLSAARTIAREIADDRALAVVRMREAELLQILGDLDGALRGYEECHGYFLSRGEPRTRIVSLLNLSVASVLCGDAVRGKTLAQEALDQARAIGYAVLEASALEDLALADATGGDYPAAIAAMERAVAMRTETSSSAWTGITLAQLALWYVNTGAADRGRACIDRMLAAEDAIARATPWPQICYWSAAQVYRACGDATAARSALERAVAVLTAELERIDEADRARYLAIGWHRDMFTALERDEWPAPAR